MALERIRSIPPLPEPPENLSGPPAALWREVVAEFDLESHQFHLLAAACDAYSRMLEARDLVDEQGPVVTDSRGGVKAHPAVAIERDCRLGFARLMRELALDVPVPDSRPQRRGGQVS